MSNKRERPPASANAGRPRNFAVGANGSESKDFPPHLQDRRTALLARRAEREKRAKRARRRSLAAAQKATPPGDERAAVASTRAELAKLYGQRWRSMSPSERRSAWGLYKFLRDLRLPQDPPSARELARLSGARNVAFLNDFQSARGRRRK